MYCLYCAFLNLSAALFADQKLIHAVDEHHYYYFRRTKEYRLITVPIKGSHCPPRAYSSRNYTEKSIPKLSHTLQILRLDEIKDIAVKLGVVSVIPKLHSNNISSLWLLGRNFLLKLMSSRTLA